MSGRGPGLDRASGSFRHSERYAATAARYSRALERERNVEEVTRDGGGATSKGGGERESLLETPDYLERQRARNDSFKRGCGRMLVFVLVLAVFGAVAAVGFDHFGRNTHGPTPPAPAPVTTDSRQSGRVVNDQPTSRAAAAAFSGFDDHDAVLGLLATKVRALAARLDSSLTFARLSEGAAGAGLLTAA